MLRFREKRDVFTAEHNTCRYRYDRMAQVLVTEDACASHVLGPGQRLDVEALVVAERSESVLSPELVCVLEGSQAKCLDRRAR